ncbi:MAG TPA: 30S ribosomal protein S6 [Pirellulales bacterium]|nr:30S ribosomal protein S6 [Pirellulales bacterium]
MLNVYEGLFIFDSNRYSRDPGGVSGQVADFVQKLGGEILVARLWEERRLAYPINGQRKGTYWLSYFRLEGKQLGALERECQLSESIMRSLVIKIDPRIVETLVSHATASAAPAKARAAEPKEAPVVEAEVPEMEEVGDVS